MGAVEEVTLSEDIRNWVLIPLTLASILMDILTQLGQRVSRASIFLRYITKLKISKLFL
jgi:hypothetical protein